MSIEPNSFAEEIVLIVICLAALALVVATLQGRLDAPINEAMYWFAK